MSPALLAAWVGVQLVAAPVKVKVVVAAEDLRVGTVLTRAQMRVVEVDSRWAGENVLRDGESALFEGRRVAVPLLKNDLLRKPWLVEWLGEVRRECRKPPPPPSNELIKRRRAVILAR